MGNDIGIVSAVACDDANGFLQSRPPEWNALHDVVGHSQYGTGGGRPGILQLIWKKCMWMGGGGGEGDL